MNGRETSLRRAWRVAWVLVALLLIGAVGGQYASAAHSSLEVRGYQDEFGVSRQMAEKHLEIQSRGAGIVEQLSEDLDKRYAGVWFDNESGEFVVPTLAGHAAVADALRGARLEGEFRTAPAQLSWSELEAAQEGLDKALERFIADRLVQTFLDPRTNAVVVLISQAVDEDERRAIRAQIAGKSAFVETREAESNRFAISLRACDAQVSVCTPPMRGGVGIQPSGTGTINGLFCTSGFNATGNTFGNRFVVTAGHCVSDFGADWLSFTLKEGVEWPNYLGHVDAGAASFPTHDYAAIKVNGNSTFWDQQPWPRIIANWGVDQEYPVTSESSSYLGETVCHVGRRTGKSCGVVTATNLTASTNKGVVYHYTEVSGNWCSGGGDSGGPIFSDHTALGIYSADDNEGTESACGVHGYYTEITEIADLLGVTVAPRVGAPPVAETEPADNPVPATVTGLRQATIHQSLVDPNGLSTTYYYQYGPTAAYGSSTPSVGAGSGWGPMNVSAILTGLKGLTTYHYRLVASNSAGISYGADATFTTPDWRPIVTTEVATNVEPKKATLKATVNPQGASTNYQFQYTNNSDFAVHGFSKATSVPIPPASVGSGGSDVKVSEAVSGLTWSTTYHFRVVAENSDGTSQGKDETFTTPDWRPTATIEAPSNVGTSSATLKGMVNPHGPLDTTYQFEWGTTPALGNKVPVPAKSIGSGTTPVAVSEAISGLQAGTLYHIRLVATNSEGTVTPEMVFETPTPTTLCKVSGGFCESAQRYTKETALQAVLKSGTKLKISSTLGEECSGSTLTGKTTADTGIPLPLSLTALTFSCSGPCKTAETRNLPYAAGLEATEGSKATVSVKGSGNGNPSVKFSSCPFGVTCTFGASELPFSVEGGSTATLVAKEAPVTLEEGSKFICGETGKLSATYEITSPKPLYPTLASETVLCKEFRSPCPAASAFAKGTVIGAALEGPLYYQLGIFGAQSCEASTMSVVSNGEAALRLPGTMNSLTLTGCTPCTSVEVKNPPYTTSLEAAGNGNGRLKVTPVIKWSGCPTGLACTFAGGIQLEVEGGSAGWIKAKEVKLPLFEGGQNCGQYVPLTANWRMSSPSALWVARAKM